MDFGESVAILLENAIRLECPFQAPDQDDPQEEPESIKDDDVNATQENSGGVLGTNLGTGEPGADKFLGNTPYKADKLGPNPRSDSKAGTAKGTHLKVLGGDYAYVVAAHHLIPGNGSLAGEEPSDIYNYMCRGKTVQGVKHSREISKNIGYCVNGAHNGVWLPGSYAVRAGKSRTGPTWSAMAPAWQYDYMIAAVCTTGNQFHDTHSNYNDAVKEILNKLAIKLTDHVDTDCEKCKGPKILPPYKVKRWLYAISSWLHQRVVPPRHAWKLPFLTSNGFQDAIAYNLTKFLTDCEKYDSAKSTQGR